MTTCQGILNQIYDIIIPTSFNDGRQTIPTAGTRIQLSTTPMTCKTVVISALNANKGTIVVGGETCVAEVTAQRGTPLLAGDTYPVQIDNLNKIYLDATYAGDGVTYSYTS